MTPTQQESSADRVRPAIRTGLFALLLWAPLPFGSVENWSVMVIECSALALGGLAIVVIWLDPSSLDSRAGSLMIPAGLLILIGILQVVPLPMTWASLIAGSTAGSRMIVADAVPEIASGTFPASFSPSDTVDALLRLTSYLLLGLAAAVSFRKPRHFSQAAAVICCGGAFQAFYGAAEYLSGHQQIFWYVKRYFLDSATGTFINRNHYAGYLAMTLPFASALLIGRKHPSTDSGGWRKSLVALGQSRKLIPLFFWTCAVGMWAGVLLSYSRGGLAAALLGTLVLTLLSMRQKRRAWLLATAFILPILYMSLQEVRAPGERFSGMELSTLDLRLPIWESTVRTLPGFLPLGSGYGTFEAVAGVVKPVEIENRLTHAHNDWLEWLLEGGIPASLAGLSFLVVSMVFRRRSRGSSRFTLAAVVAGYASLCAVGLHCVFDFPLRIPAIAMLASFLAGLCLAYHSLYLPASANAAVRLRNTGSSAHRRS